LPEINPAVSEDMLRLAEIAESRAWAWTAMLLGQPVGAAGVAISDGRGEAWALFSPVIKTLPVGLYKAVGQGLAEIKAESGVSLIVATVAAEDAQAGRFLKHLGFDLTKHWYEWRTADES
jgi:hypothetical protein